MKSIMIKIGGEIRQLSEWAKMYGISRWTMWQRYNAGCVEDELIAPLPSDCIDRFFVHKHWGGKWVWKEKSKGHPCSSNYYRQKERWVYVGKPKKM